MQLDVVSAKQTYFDPCHKRTWFRPTSFTVSFGSASIAASACSRLAMSGGAFASAATAFGTTRRILKVRPEWLRLIAAGSKTVEIRGARCPHEEWVSLASTGQQEVICRVRLGRSHPLTEEERRSNAHAVEATGYVTPWAWPIEEMELLPAPVKIPPSVAHGPVQWITRKRWEAFDQQTATSIPAVDNKKNKDEAESAEKKNYKKKGNKRRKTD